VKKLFLVFLVLLVGIAGVSAAPPRPGGADNAPQLIMSLADTAAFTEAIALICLWFDQYRERLLTENEFKTLVAGRIAVMYMREQAVINRVQRIASLTLVGFPLLC
jgi:hypothetical protein